MVHFRFNEKDLTSIFKMYIDFITIHESDDLLEVIMTGGSWIGVNHPYTGVNHPYTGVSRAGGGVAVLYHR